MRAQEVYLIFFVSCNIVLCAVSKIHPFYIYVISPANGPPKYIPYSQHIPCVFFSFLDFKCCTEAFIATWSITHLNL